MLFVGIDFGTSKSVITHMKNGKFDILLDDTGSRYYPSLASFLNDHRIFANEAKPKLISNSRYTFSSFRPLLHYLNTEDESLLNYFRSNCPENLQKGIAKVTKASTITIHQLIFSFLCFISKRIKKQETEVPRTVIFSYPDYFTNKDINQLQQLAQVACETILTDPKSLIKPVVGLISDLTALSYYYGITKSKQNSLFTDSNQSTPSKTIIFVDVGKSSTQICITEYKVVSEGRIVSEKITSASFELGGMHFDEVLESFTETSNLTFKEKAKLLKEVEKNKIVLTSSEIAHIRLEADDEELEYEIRRDDYYSKLEIYKKNLNSIFGTLLTNYNQIKSAQHPTFKPIPNFKTLNSLKIELNGGMSRAPIITSLIEEITSIVPTITMNENESVSNGCTLYAATFSKMFRSNISIKEHIDFTKFLNVFPQGFDPTNVCINLDYNFSSDSSSPLEEPETYTIKSIIKPTDFLPLTKNITINGHSTLTLKLFPSIGSKNAEEPVRMFMITSPSDSVSDLISLETAPKSVIPLFTNQNSSKRLGKFVFEMEIGLDYVIKISEVKFIFNYYSNYNYGELFKNRRNLLRVDNYSLIHKKADPVLKMEDFGIFKKEFKGKCLTNAINGINDIGFNEWAGIKETEEKWERMDKEIGVKKELRNGIEEMIYGIKGKGIVDERVEKIENWVLSEGMKAEVGELEEKLKEIEEVNKETEKSN